MAKTVRQLIQELQEIDNQDQAVIYQYFLTEHFEFEQLGTATAEQFERVAEDLSVSELWEDPAQIINDYLWNLVMSEQEEI